MRKALETVFAVIAFLLLLGVYLEFIPGLRFLEWLQ